MKTEDTAGLTPERGKSRAPPDPSSSFAGLRLPKEGEKKKNKPKHPPTQNNPRNHPRTGLTGPALRRAGYCFARPRQGGHGWSRAPRAAPAELPSPAPPAWPQSAAGHGRCTGRGAGAGTDIRGACGRERQPQARWVLWCICLKAAYGSSPKGPTVLWAQPREGRRGEGQRCSTARALSPTGGEGAARSPPAEETFGALRPGSCSGGRESPSPTSQPATTRERTSLESSCQPARRGAPGNL